MGVDVLTILSPHRPFLFAAATPLTPDRRYGTGLPDDDREGTGLPAAARPDAGRAPN